MSERNLNFVCLDKDLESQGYFVASDNYIGEIRAFITKMEDGKTIINIREGNCTTLTLVVVGKVEVYDTWEWGIG